MARLMGVPLADLLAQDRVAVAQAMAQKWGHTVLLKGAYTVIAAADGRVTLLPFANPLLGVAGSGDVLAGAIVGLLAGGMEGWETAVLAGYLHGLAGDIMAERLGDAGLLASELADVLPAARKRLINK
jgi:NAD(P)H-hydrate epimerase